MATVWVTLDGYVVRRTTAKAVGLTKEGAGYQADITWVPRGCMRDGDDLQEGDTDLECMEFKAVEKELDH